MSKIQECIKIISEHNGGCKCQCCKDTKLILLNMVNELDNRCKIDIALKILKGRNIVSPQAV